jgi:G3E family GTPase
MTGTHLQGKSMEPRTPISLVTGSLGSGKTTLLRRILSTTGRRIAVLMNEFGEVAIDSRVIEGKNVRIVELAGGCVCCSLAGEFEAAVGEIVDAVRPEHIVVEATGVAESDALTLEVEERIPRVRLDSVVCLVDAWASVRYPSVGYAARTQLAAADVVLVNKVDLVTPEQAEAVAAGIREFNESALVVPTVRCETDLDVLFGLGHEPGRASRERRADAAPPGAEGGEDSRRGAPSAPLGGDSGARAKETPPFDAFTFETGRPLSRRRFESFAEELPPSVFRAKGFVRFPEGSFLFNYVAGRADFEEMAAERTELVFIGPGLSADRDAVLESVRACEL